MPESATAHADGPSGGPPPPSFVPGHLRNLVAAHLKISPEELQPEIELGRDLCMDSLAAAELLVVIEEDMHIELLADVLAERDRVTYGDLERFVSERFDAAG